MPGEETVFNLSKMPGEETGPSLVTIALQAFGCAIERPDKIIEQYHSYCSQEGKHLLDLLRTSFIHPNLLERPPKAITALKVIRCVSKLRRAGIKFKVGKSDSFLHVKYQHGVIEMPRVIMDDFTGPFG
ncbi:putative transmembrane protein [Thalictrum thalictroides]|uniref:Putative transmembrane protein n=1 Tax=Thalictrum thalictroides TaxID=46969 RepID=A0A7J6UX08_THATH|nr:putative transmembrane protein [Thalictrum thalictroides]